MPFPDLLVEFWSFLFCLIYVRDFFKKCIVDFFCDFGSAFAVNHVHVKTIGMKIERFPFDHFELRNFVWNLSLKSFFRIASCHIQLITNISISNGLLWPNGSLQLVFNWDSWGLVSDKILDNELRITVSHRSSIRFSLLYFIYSKFGNDNVW